MLLFNLTDKYLKVLRFSRMFIADSLSEVKEIPLKDGLVQNFEIIDPDGLVKELTTPLAPWQGKEKDCAFLLHDERTYILRFVLPADEGNREIWDLIKKQIYPLLPESVADLKATFKVLDDKSPQKEVQFAAVRKSFLESYASVFEKLGFHSQLAVPGSYAIYTLIKPLLQEGETAIFVNPELKAESLIVLDNKGVLEVFYGEDLEKVKKFALEKWGRKIEKTFGRENISEVVKAYPLQVRLRPDSADISKYPRLLGLALLAKEKDALNLLA